MTISQNNNDKQYYNYCEQFWQDEIKTSKEAAQAIVPLIIKYLNPLNVIDVGCGSGMFVDQFLSHHIAAVGIDHPSTYSHYVPPLTRFIGHDLTTPLTFKVYKWADVVLCFEVGEHLPDSSSNILIETITSLSNTVLFGAAVPGQGGWNHINEQPVQYWQDKFGRIGYRIADGDNDLISEIRNCGAASWYRNNIHLYKFE